MTPPRIFDLVILGGGSAAYAAASVAAKADRTVAIVEQRAAGGTCPNHGCVPSKLFIEAADAYHAARHPRFKSIPGRPELPFDFAELVAGKDHRILKHREHYDHPEQSQVHLFHGHGRLVDSRTIAIEGGPTLRGGAVLIATGARPVVPEIDGVSGVPFLTSDLLAAAEPGEMKRLPASLLVVGGGYIGLESGQTLHRLGSRITLLVRGEQVLGDGYEPDVRACVGQALADDGMTISYGAELKAVRRDGDGVVAEVEVDGKRQKMRTAGLLLATGRRPNTDGIGLESAGVALDDAGAITVDAAMSTSVPGVWAAGDPVGHQHGAQEATPLANVMGQVAAHNALKLGSRKSVDFRVVPRTIFTEPQVATVGLTEAAARAAGRDVWTGQISMGDVARPTLMHQTSGLCKIVADRGSGEVLGVSLVGPQVGEVIHEAAMGLRFRATVDDFADLVHVFPAVAEALKITAVKMRKAR